MIFTENTIKQDLANLILQRQHKVKIDGIEIILPKQSFKLTYKERVRDADKKAEQIYKLINS